MAEYADWFKSKFHIKCKYIIVDNALVHLSDLIILLETKVITLSDRKCDKISASYRLHKALPYINSGEYHAAHNAIMGCILDLVADESLDTKINDLEAKVVELTKIIEDLKLALLYAPGGVEAKRTADHFHEISKGAPI